MRFSMKISLELIPPIVDNEYEYFGVARKLMREIPVQGFINGYNALKSLRGNYIWRCRYTSQTINEGTSRLKRKRFWEKTPEVQRIGTLVLPTKPADVSDFAIRHMSLKSKDSIAYLASLQGIENEGDKQFYITKNPKKSELETSTGYKIHETEPIITLDILLQPVSQLL